VDLIYGLPKQGLDTFRDTLRSVVALRPDRIAVYSYAHVPWLRPHQRAIDESTLPDAELKFELFGAAIEAFLAAGYEAIGMDHFALPGDELAEAAANRRLHRNFMGYTTRPASDMFGVGVSAIGDVQGAFAQNVKKLPEYYAGHRRWALPDRSRLRAGSGRPAPPVRDHAADVQLPPRPAVGRGAVRHPLRRVLRPRTGRTRGPRRPGRRRLPADRARGARRDAAGAAVRAQHLHGIRSVPARARRAPGIFADDMTGEQETGDRTQGD
jgi:hypothetical protein